MQRLVAAAIAGLLSAGLMAGMAQPATAGAPKINKFGPELKDTTSNKNPRDEGRGKRDGRSGQASQTAGQLVDAALKQYEATVKTYQASLKAYNAAMVRRDTCLSVQPDPVRCGNPTLPNTPGAAPPDLATGLATGVTMTGEQIAYIAFARSSLTPPTPVITPSPDRNRWKMAVVGYPLWLSVEGDTHPPAVNDAVGTANVSLEARVDHVEFSMGDQHSVSCRQVSTRWNPSIEAGKKSPSCGYVYEKPSLPKGNYTVTATTYWSVTWATSAENGVIDFVQSDSTQLPVGELQVLVR